MAWRILFVDDNPEVLAVMETFIRLHGPAWSATYAQGGASALTAIREQAFDIVVSDLGMPGIDGKQVLDEARERQPNAARVVFSGQPDPAKELGSSWGFVHLFVGKPCSVGQLFEALAGLLEGPPGHELK